MTSPTRTIATPRHAAPRSQAPVDSTTMALDPMHAAAHRWLLESGIRGRGDPAAAGAIRRQYDLDSRQYADFYPEVTAYAAQLHLRLAGDDRHGADWRAAVESGEWLLHAQSLEPPDVAGAYAHAIRDGRAHGGWYVFDTAIIGHALLELAQATGRSDFLTGAQRCAEWVLAHQSADGSFRACVGADDPVPWADDHCCLHGKHALLLAALWRHGGDARHRDGARRLLDWLIGLQRPDGRIDAFPGAGYAVVHTQCYALEGLLAGALWLDHPTAADAVALGARHLAARQRDTGAMPRYVGPGAADLLRRSGSRLPRLRAVLPPSDVGATAQSARVWWWAQRLTGDDHGSSVARAVAWLRRQQIVSADPAVDGGFPAGVDELFGWRRQEPWLYPWISVFAIDASRLQADPQAATELF